MGDYSDFFKMFLRFVVVEMVAEFVSKDFMTSDRFTPVLGEKGSRWFYVYTLHYEDGMSHEELAPRLAFTLHPGTPTKEEVNTVMQDTVGLFVKAGDVCVDLARKRHREPCYPFIGEAAS